METSPLLFMPLGAENRKQRTPEAKGQMHTRKGPFGGELGRSSLGGAETGGRLGGNARSVVMIGWRGRRPPMGCV